MGFDISSAAVEMAKTRFLDAIQLDMKELNLTHLVGAVHVIATELMEHPDEHVFNHVVARVLDTPSVESFIFTVPDNCMGPDEVREHTALFNEQLVRDRVGGITGWDLEVQQGDANHLLCVLRRS